MRGFYRLAMGVTLFVLGTYPQFARADSFQITKNLTVQFSGASPNDNYFGSYETPPDAWGNPGDTVFASTPYASAQVPGFSFSLAPQDKITSATLTLTFPVTQLSSNNATVNIEYVDGFPRPSDPDNPQMVDPTFGPATATTKGWDIYFNGELWLGSDLTPWLVINGNHLSSDPSQYVSFIGWLDFTAPIASPAYNWAGYIGGGGDTWTCHIRSRSMGRTP
jgi:hypothetical protein